MTMRRKKLWNAVFLAAFLSQGTFLAAQTQTDLQEGNEWRINNRQPPDKIMNAIGVLPGMVIGEIGAGRGRFTVHLAVRVGPTGKVYANDIKADGLAHIEERCRKNEIANVETILGQVDDPLFPEASLDMAFMILTYHHLSHPADLLKNLVPDLKPGATVVVVDPDPAKDLDGSGRESTSREEIERDAGLAGFELVRVDTSLARDTIFILKVKSA